MTAIVLSVIDFLMAPFVFLSAVLLLFVRRQGFSEMKRSRATLLKVGLIPVRNHYFEPFVDPARFQKSLGKDRDLPGINLNEEEQMAVLHRFNFSEELLTIPLEDSGALTYYYHNKNFEAGDCEYLYNIIRTFKPKRIIEIGSEFPTSMAMRAIEANSRENAVYRCELISIEPYEKQWLERLGIKIIRQPVEEVDKSLFVNLEANDILFIDSSYIIKPQGDVLFEQLEISPMLNPGVLIHIYDIFTPRDYPEEWVLREVRLWNEQYLVEAFLSFNKDFRIIGALNYLKSNHFEELSKKCPI